MMGLTEIVRDLKAEGRTGKSMQHQIPWLIRQPVSRRTCRSQGHMRPGASFGITAGEVGRGREGLEKNGGEPGNGSRFEKEILARDGNMVAFPVPCRRFPAL